MLQNKKDTTLMIQTNSFLALIMVGLKYYSKLEFIWSPEKVRVKKDLFILNVLSRTLKESMICYTNVSALSGRLD
jgi:hypothetical protein